MSPICSCDSCSCQDHPALQQNTAFKPSPKRRDCHFYSAIRMHNGLWGSSLPEEMWTHINSYQNIRIERRWGALRTSASQSLLTYLMYSWTNQYSLGCSFGTESLKFWTDIKLYSEWEPVLYLEILLYTVIFSLSQDFVRDLCFLSKSSSVFISLL